MLSHVAYEIKNTLKVKHTHVLEIIATLLGYQTYAAYITFLKQHQLNNESYLIRNVRDIDPEKAIMRGEKWYPRDVAKRIVEEILSKLDLSMFKNFKED